MKSVSMTESLCTRTNSRDPLSDYSQSCLGKQGVTISYRGTIEMALVNPLSRLTEDLLTLGFKNVDLCDVDIAASD